MATRDEERTPLPLLPSPDPGEDAAKKRGSKRSEHATLLFSSGFPDDPRLATLLEAFREGRYLDVRRGAAALEREGETAALRNAARELRRRLDPDPIAVRMLLGGILLLLFVVAWAYGLGVAG